MVAVAERLERALARARKLAPRLEGRRVRRERDVQIVPWDFTPWWAQRMFLRVEDAQLAEVEQPWGKVTTLTYSDGKGTRMIVAGRQSGKTEVACRKVLQVMGSEPGSYSLLLAPVYKNAQATIDKLKRVMRECGLEALGWQWKEQQKRLIAPNGSILAVFSADKDDSVRGPTITGVLWFDEAAMLSDKARQVAAAALSASRNPRTLITTTPMGLNWVYRMWADDSPEAARRYIRVRFRTIDSPHANQEGVEEERRKMTPEMAQQEFDAVFVASLFLAFPEELRERMWVTTLPKREAKDAKNVLGIDLGKEQDFCVMTAGNKFGEYVPLDRWNRLNWVDTTERIAAAAKRLEAIVVLDQGHGGGYGNVVADLLRREHGVRVMVVNTGNPRTKAELVEATRLDAEYYKVKLLRPSNKELAEIYEDELSKFQGKQKASKGQRWIAYEGPQIEGEHDDCPISLCLAHWGVQHAWEGVWEDNSAAGDFLAQPGLGGSGDDDFDDTPGEGLASYMF